MSFFNPINDLKYPFFENQFNFLEEESIFKP